MAVLCFYPYIPEQLSEQVLSSAGPDRGILSDLRFRIYAESNHSLCSEHSVCRLSLHVLLSSSSPAGSEKCPAAGITSAQPVSH